ncbi:MAG: beta-lactamase family protein, partial [Planctomycetaceae bacterium]|nr:beta-lactamase family protein [Planctomycetaceae bacterium]
MISLLRWMFVFTAVLTAVPDLVCPNAFSQTSEPADQASLRLKVADAGTTAAGVHDYSSAIQKLVAAIQHEVTTKQLPAFSISLVDGDHVVWEDGFGFQDANQTEAATAKTIYRVGSISKLFTDIAVMQMVEQGKLDLDAPIETYVPDFAPHNPHGVALTLRQMMAHRSGLVRESPVGNYFDSTEPTLRATIESLNRTSLVYKPETRTKYSNAAIAVVGAALESVLEISHPQQVQKTIL